MKPIVPVLKVHRLNGVPTAQISFGSLPKKSELGYFGIRYYPQTIPASVIPIHAIKHFEEHSGIASLNDRLLFTCQTSISKTSKLAVIRARLKRRLASAFIVELNLHGSTALPKQPMNVVVSPEMSVLHAPFEKLREDVWQTYIKARDAFEKMPPRKKSSNASRRVAEPRSPPYEKRRPDLKGDGSSQKNIALTIKELPKSKYLDQFGGANALLNRIRAQSNSLGPFSKGLHSSSA